MTPEKRKTAIKWLQNEIRSLRLAPTINGCGPENWADLLEIMETCLEAVRGYFVVVNKTSPLKLDQLREMKGQPVWVKVLGWTDIRCDGWCEVEVRHQNTTDEYAAVAWPGSEIEDIGRTEDYGKTWLAYAYPPAHIDREAWTSEWKDHYKSGASAGTGYVCSSCDMWNGRKSHICPSCGKAMDEDGLAMLEKRLRGW